MDQEPKAASAASGPLSGQLVADRYRVEELLGEGGMGAVYRATHVHMHKPVALKVLHREMTLNEEARLRFEREAVASARIDHPHVTGATDFGKLPDGACYLVLDYISGQSLKQVLNAEGKLEVGRAVFITRQIASALDAAHRAGVIHRDLKPENVMLIEHKGEADFVKVLDFGIAKLESRESGSTVRLTQVGAVFGTPEYMSPEQAGGNPADGRADLYTIGVLLFEMLSGETPFQGETIVAILMQHLTAEPPELPDSVPLPVRRIVRKLLQKDPELRFQSAAELLDALDATRVANTIPAPALPRARGDWRSRVESAVSFVNLEGWPTLRRRVIRTVPLRGRAVPWWTVSASFALGVFLVLTLWPGEPDPAGNTLNEPAATRDDPNDAPTLEGVAQVRSTSVKQAAPKVDLDAARRGEPATLRRLEALPQETRSVEQSAALIVGQFNAGNPSTSLAILEALLADGSPHNNAVVAHDEVLRAVMATALLDETSEPALGLLAEHFGERGADVLYAWSRDRPRGVGKDFGTHTARALSASKRQSAALAIARELTSAKGCHAFKKLLPRAVSAADQRALGALQRRVSRRGCGILRIGDCFRCLRGDSSLGDAIEAASERPAPEIPAPLEPGGTGPASSGGAKAPRAPGSKRP